MSPSFPVLRWHGRAGRSSSCRLFSFLTLLLSLLPIALATISDADGTKPKKLYEVRPFPGRGLGTFAAAPIEMGTRVLKEKPFLDVDFVDGAPYQRLMELTSNPALLSAELRDLVVLLHQYPAAWRDESPDDPAAEYVPDKARRGMHRVVELIMEDMLESMPKKIRKKLWALHDAFVGESPSGSVGEVKHNNKTISGLMRTNSWKAGLFEKLSRVNHSCRPNVTMRPAKVRFHPRWFLGTDSPAWFLGRRSTRTPHGAFVIRIPPYDVHGSGSDSDPMRYPLQDTSH